MELRILQQRPQGRRIDFLVFARHEEAGHGQQLQLRAGGVHALHALVEQIDRHEERLGKEAEGLDEAVRELDLGASGGAYDFEPHGFVDLGRLQRELGVVAFGLEEVVVDFLDVVLHLLGVGVFLGEHGSEFDGVVHEVLLANI